MSSEPALCRERRSTAYHQYPGEGGNYSLCELYRWDHHVFHLEGSLCRVNGFPGNWQIKEHYMIEQQMRFHTHACTHTHNNQASYTQQVSFDKSSLQTCISHVLQPKPLLADISASECDQFRQPMVYKFLPRMRERERGRGREGERERETVSASVIPSTSVPHLAILALCS